MKRTCFALAIVSVALAGCHHDETTYTAPDGSKVSVSKDGSATTVVGADGSKATLNNDGSSMTVTNDKGEKTSIGAAVSEGDLGLPFYPGSTEQKGGSTVQDLPKQKIVMSVRTSKDDPEQVGKFYKDKL